MTHNAPAPYTLPATREYQFGHVALKLPRLQIAPDKAIYVLNILGGDPELVYQLSIELCDRLDTFDGREALITAEGKAIHLVYELASMNVIPYYVLRKSCKPYMGNKPLQCAVDTITTGEQTLYLDEKDRAAIRGKRFVFVDDVISSGATLEAAKKLVELAGGTIIGALALAIEGDCQPALPTQYLCRLPIERS